MVVGQVWTWKMTGAVGKPLFCFQDGKHPVMFFEAFSNAQQRNTFTTFFNERNQTLVIRDVFMGYAYSSYRSIGRGDLFLESVPPEVATTRSSLTMPYRHLSSSISECGSAT
jgi:hypothetical protein